MKNELLSKNDFKRILFKYYGIKIKKIEKIVHSFTNCYILYGDEKYFAKVFTKYNDIIKIKKEYELLLTLRKESFNVPSIIKTKTKKIYLIWRKHYIFLEKFIDGYSCDDVEISESELLKTAKLLGKMHRALNNRYDDINKEIYWKNLNINKERKKLEAFLKYFNKFSKDTNNDLIIKTINHRLRMLPKLKKLSAMFDGITYVMTHGDYSKRNLLKDSYNNIYIIDFSDAGVYPASWELIRSYFISTNSCKNGNLFNYELFYKYVKSYLEEFPLNKNDILLMPYLFLYQIITSNYRYKEYLETKDIKYLKFMEWKENMSYFLEKNASKINNLFLSDIEKKF